VFPQPPGTLANRDPLGASGGRGCVKGGHDGERLRCGLMGRGCCGLIVVDGAKVQPIFLGVVTFDGEVQT